MPSNPLSLSDEAQAKLTLMEMAGVTVFYAYGANNEIEIHVAGGKGVSNCYFTNPTAEEGISQAFEYYTGCRKLYEYKD